MIDPVALLNDLKPQVRALENDLRERAEEPKFAEPLREEWQNAARRSRTDAQYPTWLEGQITQAAVAWVLNTVFLRFCEDNRLIDEVYLSGRGERLDLAKESQQRYFEKPENASKTDREWIEKGLRKLAKASQVSNLFGVDREHNPMWRITPSLEGAKALIDFWRTSRPATSDDGTDAATVPVHDFTDPEWSTRFLGDLYQDLSEHAKKTYALLQTPEFVEEFILDLTLKEAFDEFGLEPEPPEACPEELNLPRGLRVIDPTCGSGHFLLGAFHRILERWQHQAPGADKWDLVNRALYSVHGVDKNAFAVVIARFRLLIAAMKAGEVKRFADAPEFVLNIATGDSLIHGRGGPNYDQGRWDISNDGEILDEDPIFTYATEDISDYMKTVDLLGINSYHVVVGNPPYIKVKDKTENKNYRWYKSCSGTYALSVPFAERFFQLAIRAGEDRRGSGYVGQITANSFMKREFGKKLIEEFFPTIRLTHVIDTSGAYIPGHGTPTVILVGRRVYPREEPVRAVLGIRGEPSEPADPARGHVWRAIEEQIHVPESDSNWVTTAEIPGKDLNSHPWNLSGGGASDLKKKIDAAAKEKLGNKVESIGRTTATGEDDLYFLFDNQTALRLNEKDYVRDIVVGEYVRDFTIHKKLALRNPYTNSTNAQAIPDDHYLATHALWPARTLLANRKIFGKTMAEQRKPWTSHLENYPSKLRSRLSITFAFVATHNNFALEREGALFNRTAPAIKLRKGASEEEHLALLGILNSSTACFWLKQVSQDKGNRGGERSTGRYAWESYYEFTSTKLQDFPLPRTLPLENGQHLDSIARHLESLQPTKLCEESVPSREDLDAARANCLTLQGKMIAVQEELDWQVYRDYGILTDAEYEELRVPIEELPSVALGERAFEILIAPRTSEDEATKQWFMRHHSKPVSGIPEHWPTSYREVVQRRIETIKSRKDIRLIECPEHKRRWEWESWQKNEKAALRNWLLNRCEARNYWFAPDDSGVDTPRVMTIGRLADRLQADEDFVSVARLYAGDDVKLIDVLTEILDAEHVPFLPALRYKDSGLRKREQWQETWTLQRQEDETGTQVEIKVPPRYTGADFRRNSYWRSRGKLDVPKERFISYPHASPDGDETLLLGWAGWDHREQAHVLFTLIDERTTRDDWGLEQLMPLLAGLDEVLPWVKQWHGDVDPDTGLNPAVVYEGYIQQQLELHRSLPREELAKWRPPKRTAKGKATKKKAAE
ncbi:BREX-2 system adenine-specific DNA-methyltransferase PglX [Actinomadura algeriensis]|uniref:site-specific DNA-methyltransferase (adenine-specific) n=1 Tax=Actinomadura algeriensis TaxID=1679523 RepID=A0ABR9JJY0_9ACTN|nr:BREX-2 system adenine-specific DNA-methyltransferase PglX [Actinomadura algeriensis]MBE1530873.1 hypothetical protein [Actinomadura algeriensis]